MRKTFKGANEIILNVKSTGMRLNGMEEMSEAICNESVRWAGVEEFEGTCTKAAGPAE